MRPKTAGIGEKTQTGEENSEHGKSLERIQDNGVWPY